MMADGKVYHVKDIQKVLGLSRNSVMNLITSGRLKTVKAGRRWLIPAWAIDEFLGRAN